MVGFKHHRKRLDKKVAVRFTACSAGRESSQVCNVAWQEEVILLHNICQYE